MIEKALKDKLKRIFDLKKASFDVPGESQEQDCLFIQIDTARNTVKDGSLISRVTGKVRIFANSEKLPIGFFAQKIANAEPEDTKELFFFEIEESSGTFQNLVERSASFVFLFSGQLAQPTGSIESIETIEVDE